jgi:hypothetical protein
MVTRRLCAYRMPNGEQCQSPPLRDGQFCFMHSPEHAEDAQKARELGRLRRKREVTISGAYEFGGLNNVPGIRRVLEIAILDTLSMDNSLSRNRTLAYLIMVALKALEVGDLEDRISILEQAVHGRHIEKESVFDAEPNLLENDDKEAK